jgi:hypothetical protein
MRLKRRYVAALFCAVVGFVLLALLPSIVTSRAVLLPLIDSYAGIAPLKVDFTRVSAGWFAPVSVEGLQVVDAQGAPVVKVGAVTTEKGLLSWMLASQNLGTVQINDVEVDMAVAGGTTSLEEALAPLMKSDEPEEPKEASQIAGAIELVNARVTLRDAQHPDVWMVDIPSFKTQLPGPGQVIGPTELSAKISDASGATSGTIAADVTETTAAEVRSFNIRAAIDHVPLAFWHIVHERLPDVPIDQLSGFVSARIAGSLIDADRWTIHAQQLSGDQLVIAAPSLVGPKPARLESIRMSGQAALSDGSLALESTQLATDVGGLTASGKFPWPLALPTLTAPWLPGAQLNAEGSIDLAKLAAVAETLVPMRGDTRLVSGSATFRASQQLNSTGQPSSLVNVQLGDLVALAGGQQLTWDKPLTLDLSAAPQKDGQVAFLGTCAAEFCQLKASGSVASGSLEGEVNLDRLQQRLSQWFDLPLSTMTGTADVDMRWSQTQPGLLVAEGQLQTTPLVIAMTSGGELREPAWRGTFTAQGNLTGSQLTSVQRAHLELVAQSERLGVDLLEPLQFSGNAAPAAFTISSEGSLDLWQKRAVMLKLLDPSMTLAGKYSLGASGRIDTSRVELQQANWRTQPFEIGSGGTRLVEPEMVGNFQGRVDTADLTRLAIEKLVVQAHSFSLSAADAASSSGDGSRSGTGAFIADLAQLMRNVRSDTGSVPATQLVLPPGVGAPPTAPQSQLALSGQVNGSLRWQVNSKNASLEMDAKTDQIDVIQQVAGGQPTRLWSEAQVMAALKGAWDAATGRIQVDSMQLQAPWMHYAGTMEIENGQDTQTLRAKGQCLYDAALVAEKLQPYIGTNVQMAGRKTVPVDVSLTIGGPATATSTLAGLQAMTRIGWEQARVVGIEVGAADVPVTVAAGQLTTKTEIPVSGGILRWDIQSDLTAPQTVLIQKPMTVLENVAITPQMCQSWLKFVTPLLAEATSVDGRLSLQLNEARFNIANPRDQIIDGNLVIHSATVGPGPLSNQVITLVQQINAIRKKELATAVSSQHVWLQMPVQTIPFRMENGRVMHRDLKFHVGDVNLLSSGAVDIEGRMELNTQMPIPDDWVEKSPLLAGLRGQSLQFPIRGTLTSPQVDAQFLKDFGRQAVTQAAEGLLQQQLQRGLGKLFGPGMTPGLLPLGGAAPAGAAPTAPPAAGTPPLPATPPGISP